MKVGWGRTRISVEPGSPLGGYADRTGSATETLDEIELHCLCLIDRDQYLVLVVADLICINSDLADAIAVAVSAVLPEASRVAVWSLATHTHSAPDQNCGVGSRRTPPAWLDRIPRIARQAAQLAVADAVDCEARQHLGNVVGVGSVRAHLGSDPSVPVDAISFHSTDTGKLVGVLAVLPIHATVLPASNTKISGDLSGAVRRNLAAVLNAHGPSSTPAAGPGRPDVSEHPWVVVATGCAGDISTRLTRRSQTPAECERLGRLAAHQIAEILRWESTPITQSDVGLPSATEVMRLPVRQADAASLVPVATSATSVQERIEHTIAQGRKVESERADRFPDGKVELVVSVARLGDLSLIGIGAEPYLALRSAFAQPCIVLGYANGYAGYLPDPPSFTALSYEVLSSPFAPDAMPTVVARVGQLLNRMLQEDNHD